MLANIYLVLKDIFALRPILSAEMLWPGPRQPILPIAQPLLADARPTPSANTDPIPGSSPASSSQPAPRADSSPSSNTYGSLTDSRRESLTADESALAEGGEAGGGSGARLVVNTNWVGSFAVLMATFVVACWVGMRGLGMLGGIGGKVTGDTPEPSGS